MPATPEHTPPVADPAVVGAGPDGTGRLLLDEAGDAVRATLAAGRDVVVVDDTTGHLVVGASQTAEAEAGARPGTVRSYQDSVSAERARQSQIGRAHV